MSSLALSMAAPPATAQVLCSLLPCVLLILARYGCSSVHQKRWVQLQCIPLGIWATLATARAVQHMGKQAACCSATCMTPPGVTQCCFAVGAMRRWICLTLHQRQWLAAPEHLTQSTTQRTRNQRATAPRQRSSIWYTHATCNAFLNTAHLQEQYGGLETQEQLLKFIHDPLVNMPAQEQLLQEEFSGSLTHDHHHSPSLGNLQSNMYGIFLDLVSMCCSLSAMWGHVCYVETGPTLAHQPAVPDFDALVTPARPSPTVQYQDHATASRNSCQADVGSPCFQFM